MEVRVMVASEVRLYREGLQRVLRGIAGIVLVGVASTAEEVFAQAMGLLPTVILLDIAMAHSLSVARHLSKRPINGGVVILGIPEGGGSVMNALPANILGYVTRDGTVSDLLAAIRSAGCSDLYCADSLMPVVASRVRGSQVRTPPVRIEQLTAREMEILELLREGFSNKTISRHLGIGLSTVKNHVHSVLAKLDVHCRSEAVAALYRHEGRQRASPVAHAGDEQSILAGAIA